MEIEICRNTHHIFCFCLVLIYSGGSGTCRTKGVGNQSVWRYPGRPSNFTALRDRLLRDFAPNCPLAPETLPPLQQQCCLALAANSQSNIDTCGLFQRKKEFTMSEAEEYEVETIVSKRLRKGKLILFLLHVYHEVAFRQGRVPGKVEGMGGPR